MKSFIIKLLILGSMVNLTACSQFVSPLQSNNSVGQVSTVNTPVPAGFYRVQAGDNLYRISLRFNHSMNELSQWNHLSDINQLEVGQVLRVVPPAGAVATPATTVNYQPQQTPVMPRVSQPSIARSTNSNIKLKKPKLEPIPLSQLRLKRPVMGKIIAPYQTVLNGIEFGGRYRSPVVASLPGIVITVDNFRGYGNIVMIRRDRDILVTYGFLDKVLVKVNQEVKAGQTIGLMGKDPNNQAGVYLELRTRMGTNNFKAINPTSYFK